MSAPSTRAPAAASAQAEKGAEGTRKTGGMLSRISVSWYFAFLITVILVVGEASSGILGGYERLPLALGSAIVFEVVLARLFRGIWPHPLSAYISGNSIAILLKPAAGLYWPFVCCAGLSIVSKYALTFRGKHLWNPTNFGISALLLIAPGSVAILSHEWGNEILSLVVVLAVGTFVAMKGRLLHISGTFALAFLVFAALRSVLPGGDSFTIEAAPITGPMYLLFIFFMITDPRTVVRGRWNQALVAVIIAAADCAIRVAGNNDLGLVRPLLPAPPLFALMVVGPIALVTQELVRSRR